MPIAAKGFDDLLADLPREFMAAQSVIIVGISGGSDSTALLLLLRDYIRHHHLSTRLIAVTIDHRLRAESAQEADYVAQWCRSLGITHITKQWLHNNPQTGLSQKGRDARYALLAQVARENQAKLVFVGHTSDDQVETYLMRQARSGQRGLACMSPFSRLEGDLLLVRPLLNIRRQQLRQFLTASNIIWVDDPSNNNEKYERVRMRHAVSHYSAEEHQRLITKITQLGQARQQQAETLQHSLYELQIQAQFGYWQFFRQRMDCIDAKQGPYLLAFIAATLGGAAYLPDAENIQKLWSFCRDISAQNGAMTVAGSVVERLKNSIRIRREARNIESLSLLPHQRCLWDRRYYITNKSGYRLTATIPDHAQIKHLLTRLDLPDATRQSVHMPTLKTALMIEWEDRSGQRNYDIPVVSGGQFLPSNVFLQPVGGLFSHMAHGYDAPFTCAIENLLTLNINVERQDWAARVPFIENLSENR